MNAEDFIFEPCPQGRQTSGVRRRLTQQPSAGFEHLLQHHPEGFPPRAMRPDSLTCETYERCPQEQHWLDASRIPMRQQSTEMEHVVHLHAVGVPERRPKQVGPTYEPNACELQRRHKHITTMLTTPAQTITPDQPNACEKRLPSSEQIAQLHRTPSRDTNHRHRREGLHHA